MNTGAMYPSGDSDWELLYEGYSPGDSVLSFNVNTTKYKEINAVICFGDIQSHTEYKGWDVTSVFIPILAVKTHFGGTKNNRMYVYGDGADFKTYIAIFNSNHPSYPNKIGWGVRNASGTAITSAFIRIYAR